MNPIFSTHGEYEAPILDRALLRDEHFLPALREALAEARAEIEAIRCVVAPDFKNTVEALAFAGDKLGSVSKIFSLVSSSDSNDTIREIEADFDRELTQFSDDIWLDGGLFARVEQIHAKREALGLADEELMLLDETRKSFVRAGALLGDSDKEKLRALNIELAQLGTRYSNNLVKATEAYAKRIDDEDLLAGVPDRAKAIYRAAAEESGTGAKYIVRLEPYPLDILTHAQNRGLREEIYKAYASLCVAGEFDNRDVVKKIAALRKERASLLGYASHAAYVLEDRMAGDVATVRSFLQKNLSVYRPAAQKELAALTDFAHRQDGIETLKAWDIPYYNRWLKEQIFSFEMEKLRPYLNLEKVLDGLRVHAEKLFGIRLREHPAGTMPVLTPDVKVYDVVDAQSERVIGLFYADYYARPGAKRGGAWMDSLRDRGIHYGKDQIPLITNSCNFAKPTPTQPSFLSMDEMQTVFHEFGHALHGLLAETRYPSLAGPNVKWDFVELPSQVQENWADKKEVLDTFARHHETGEPMPASMVKTLQDMRNFDAGWFGLRQTYLALLDMAFAEADPMTIAADLEGFEKTLADEVLLVPREVGLMCCQFSHIFGGGYSAGYYSYKWAEVLDADVFSAFESAGLYDPALSRKLRTLYAKGGTVAPMDLFIEMMGRRPDQSALFKREGFASA